KRSTDSRLPRRRGAQAGQRSILAQRHDRRRRRHIGRRHRRAGRLSLAPRARGKQVFDRDSMKFLKELTEAVVEASRVRPGESVGASPTNSTGCTLIRPGGRDCYPAFWIRDFAMSLDIGFVSYEEMLHALRLIAKTQNGPS